MFCSEEQRDRSVESIVEARDWDLNLAYHSLKESNFIPDSKWFTLHGLGDRWGERDGESQIITTITDQKKPR